MSDSNYTPDDFAKNEGFTNADSASAFYASKKFQWQPIETAPINEWVLFADSKHTMGDKPPFVNIDKLNKRREATVNYTQNYTHWMLIQEMP